MGWVGGQLDCLDRQGGGAEVGRVDRWVYGRLGEVDNSLP